MNHVYQIYLNNWYLYYYYSFLGEHFDTGWSGSMEMDETPQRQSGLHRQHSPHHERLFLSVRRVDRQSCPKPHQTQNIKHYLKTDGPTACFKNIYIMCCKRVKSTDVSHKQKTPKKSVETTSIRVAKSVVVTEVTTNVVKLTLIFIVYSWNKMEEWLIDYLYFILWYLILITLIWFFKCKFPLLKNI